MFSVRQHNRDYSGTMVVITPFYSKIVGHSSVQLFCNLKLVVSAAVVILCKLLAIRIIDIAVGIPCTSGLEDIFMGIFRRKGNFHRFLGRHIHFQRLLQGDGQVASPICQHRAVVSLKGKQRRVIRLGIQVARILRQRGKAQKAVAAHRAGNRPHAVVTVPHNDAQTAAAHRSHQPCVIGAAVRVRVKEDNIALLRRIPFHAAVQAPRFSGKRPHPAGAVGCIRHRLA